jgi:hypothetical protein
VAAGEARFGVGEAGGRGDAEGFEEGKGADPALEVVAALDQHRNSLAGQQQRQQGHQVGLAAGAVVGGQHHQARARRHGHVGGAGVEGTLETEQLVRRFSLDAHGQDDGAQLQVRHAAIHHVAEEGLGLIDGEGFGAFRPAADFLDEGGVGHDGQGDGVGRAASVADAAAQQSRRAAYGSVQRVASPGAWVHAVLICHWGWAR